MNNPVNILFNTVSYAVPWLRTADTYRFVVFLISPTDILCKTVFICGTPTLNGDRAGTVVKVLCYKSEGCWFDSRWCHGIFH